ncbi:hypothetical protein [Taibaiella soli]|uniref:Phage holin n=1 Tax=Taibaiella soli TaxID=1649169 RepID=A0A2W2B0X9_9BACT|nr:hypothetical protein [Taibaiella soli]PZF73894.1 hypothetical protein DN068_06010 [Taibaiella soli]
MKSFIIEFFQRLKTSSPAFFIKLRIAMIALGVLIVTGNFLVSQNLFAINQATKDVLTAAADQLLIIISTVTGMSFLPKAASVGKSGNSSNTENDAPF